jgi:hypothetical protein
MLGCPLIRPEDLGDVFAMIDYCGRVHGGANWQSTALLGLLVVVVPVALIIGFALWRRYTA